MSSVAHVERDAWLPRGPLRNGGAESAEPKGGERTVCRKEARPHGRGGTGLLCDSRPNGMMAQGSQGGQYEAVLSGVRAVQLGSRQLERGLQPTTEMGSGLISHQ